LRRGLNHQIRLRPPFTDVVVARHDGEARRTSGPCPNGGIPIIHIQHFDGPSSLYDNEGETGAIALRVAPGEGEPVVVRNYPNSFVQTDLVLVGCA
jgi:hypothetical protein